MKVRYEFDADICWYEADLEESNEFWNRTLKDYTREDFLELCPQLNSSTREDFDGYETHQLVDYVKENGEWWFNEEIHEYFEEKAFEWYKTGCKSVYQEEL